MTLFSKLSLRLAVLWSAVASPVAADSSGWEVVEVATNGPVNLLTTDADGATVVIAGGRPQRVVVEAGRFVTRPHETWEPAPPLPRDALPDGEAVVASVPAGDGAAIRAAWYVEPTTRYDHAILGDAIEAGGLAVTDGAGREHRLRLPETQVFEDRFPRLADIDGDGRDEVVTIRSEQAAGAGVAVYRLGADGLEEMASIPVIGTPNRWLNIAALADLNADGQLEIALVKTPHIGGTLEIWAWRAGRLERVAAEPGFSNHAIRTPEQRLSAVADFIGAGKTELALPSADRSRLRIMRFGADGLTERAAIDLPVPVATDIGVVTADGRPAIMFAGPDRKLRLVRRR